jgi:hypothetical protein
MADAQVTSARITGAEITSAAGAVVALAAHFDRLRSRANELLGGLSGRERGYFTPTEEELVRHLLVSYWKARNALLDLVDSLRHQDAAQRGEGVHRDDPQFDDPHRPDLFLVGYAGALLLVDAARFMRESFGDAPVIQRKLNEPDELYGIPPRVYATVERSLTNPVHAWHLAAAHRYFRAHRDRLAEWAADEPLAALFAAIDRFDDRLDVPPHRYLLAALKIRARLWTDSVHRRLVHRPMFGVQKVTSSMISDVYTRPGHQPRLPDDVVAQLRGLIRPGDVLVTRKAHALTNYFLPGYWPHAALYIGDPHELSPRIDVSPNWARLDRTTPLRVLEALKDGVWVRSLASPFTVDAICVLRPQLSTQHVSKAISRGLVHEGKSYDFDFDFTQSERLVCTEVVYRSYEGIGGLRFELTPRLGRMTLSAEDLIAMALAGQGFDPVAAYAPDYQRELLTDKSAAALLRRTKES